MNNQVNWLVKHPLLNHCTVPITKEEEMKEVQEVQEFMINAHYTTVLQRFTMVDLYLGITAAQRYLSTTK